MTRTLLRWLMRPARVAAVETLSPHFRLVDLEGEALRNVAWTAGQKIQVAMGSGLSARTYTPMSWDADSGRTRMLTFAQAMVPVADGQAACAKATPASSSVRAARSIYPALQSPVVLFGDETSFGLAAALRDSPQAAGAIHVFEVSDVAELRQVAGSDRPRPSDVDRAHRRRRPSRRGRSRGVAPCRKRHAFRSYRQGIVDPARKPGSESSRRRIIAGEDKGLLGAGQDRVGLASAPCRVPIPGRPPCSGGSFPRRCGNVHAWMRASGTPPRKAGRRRRRR